MCVVLYVTYSAFHRKIGSLHWPCWIYSFLYMREPVIFFTQNGHTPLLNKTTVYQKPVWSILSVMFFTFRGPTGTLKPYLLITCARRLSLTCNFHRLWKQNGDHLKPRLLWIRTWWCSLLSGKWVAWLLLFYFISFTHVWKGLRLLGTVIYFL